MSGKAAKRLSKEIQAMIMTNKLLPVALVAALIGGSVGAFVMHSKNSSAATQATAQETVRPADTQYAQLQPTMVGSESYVPAQFETVSEQTAYKSGFADGFRAAQAGVTGAQATSSLAPLAPVTQSRVVYRNASRNVSRSSGSRRVYYDYQTQPRKRSFWQKHRDKLTVAMGTGGGAILGGLIGGKKGAAIGALAGGGGSALYTYKIRNRSRRY
jgi:hypothetical protein